MLRLGLCCPPYLLCPFFYRLCQIYSDNRSQQTNHAPRFTKSDEKGRSRVKQALFTKLPKTETFLTAAMQASRASAAPREQAARVPKIGRQAAHSAPHDRATRTGGAHPQKREASRALRRHAHTPQTRAHSAPPTLRRKQIPADKQKNESGAEPCGSAPDPYMIRGKMMSYLR